MQPSKLLVNRPASKFLERPPAGRRDLLRRRAALAVEEILRVTKEMKDREETEEIKDVADRLDTIIKNRRAKQE